MTVLDVGVIAIVLVSALLAMIRGFVREFLSVLAWVGAVVATIFGLPLLAPLAKDFIAPEWLAEALSAFAIFAITLVVVGLATFRLAERVPAGHVGILDRTGGFLFGAVRGLLLVAIAHIFFAWLVEREDYPVWVSDARLLPIASAMAEILKEWVDAAAQRAAGEDGRTAGSPFEPDADNGAPEGYNSQQRRALDELVEPLGPSGDR